MDLILLKRITSKFETNLAELETFLSLTEELQINSEVLLQPAFSIFLESKKDFTIFKERLSKYIERENTFSLSVREPFHPDADRIITEADVQLNLLCELLNQPKIQQTLQNHMASWRLSNRKLFVRARNILFAAKTLLPDD